MSTTLLTAPSSSIAGRTVPVAVVHATISRRDLSLGAQRSRAVQPSNVNNGSRATPVVVSLVLQALASFLQVVLHLSLVVVVVALLTVRQLLHTLHSMTTGDAPRVARIALPSSLLVAGAAAYALV